MARAGRLTYNRASRHGSALAQLRVLSVAAVAAVVAGCLSRLLDGDVRDPPGAGRKGAD
jgi:hypothetical protein